MPLESGLDHPPLDATPASVHDADARQPRGRRPAHKLLHDRHNLAGQETMQVELGSDRDDHRVVVVEGIRHATHPGRCVAAGESGRAPRVYFWNSYVALTLVVMPPRAEKLP